MAGGWVGAGGSAIGGSPVGTWVTGVGTGSVRGGRVAADSPSWTGGGGSGRGGGHRDRRRRGRRGRHGGLGGRLGQPWRPSPPSAWRRATGAGLADGGAGRGGHGLHRGRLVALGHLLDLHGAGGDDHRGGHAGGGLGRDGADAGGDGAARCRGARRAGSTLAARPAPPAATLPPPAAEPRRGAAAEGRAWRGPSFLRITSAPTGKTAASALEVVRSSERNVAAALAGLEVAAHGGRALA